jgi:predicted enzyme related to lactoylglutathione lyase
MFDCLDHVRVASFWEALLGLEHRKAIGPYVFFEQPGRVGLGFQRVERPNPGKNRVHIDLQSGDLAGVVDRVVELGGAFVDGYEHGGFLVLADPEGNEFCVVPTDGAHLDDAGVAHYPRPAPVTDSGRLGTRHE